MIGNATGNVIELNLVTGNTNGIYVAAAVGSNVIRNNTAIGNPPIQVGNTRPEVRALDIVNLSPPNRTVFDRNKCLTGLAAPCPAVNP